MVNKKDKYPSNAWEYTDWLLLSGRLTTAEHLQLKKYLLQLEAESAKLFDTEGC